LRNADILTIDPDAVLRNEDAASAVSAGKIVLARREAALAALEDFAIETTLAGRGPLLFMREARSRGYTVDLVYVATSSVEKNIERVRERTMRGGHDVPVIDIRRRYPRSLANLAAAVDLSDSVLVFDNTEVAPKLIASRESASWTFAIEPLPQWFAEAITHGDA
jgi:predicted ABC-type ATPase